MIKTIKKLADIVTSGGKPPDKELALLYPDELVDYLVRTMVPVNHNFRETILATREKSKLGFSCLILLGLVPRSKLFRDKNYCSLTPTIPLVYALQKGFDFHLSTEPIAEAKDWLQNSAGAYSGWDTKTNFEGSLLSLELALGREIAKAYRARSVVSLEYVISARRSLKDYSWPRGNKGLQYIIDLQLWNAKADLRDARMILDINDWDKLPEAMIA